MNRVFTNKSRENFTQVLYKEKYADKMSAYTDVINSVVHAFTRIELLSVIEGTRDAHLNFYTPQELEIKQKEFAKDGLIVIPLNKEGNRKSGGYGNHSVAYTGGNDFVWRSIITRPENEDKWKEIWNIRSSNVHLGEYLIGEGLGYPSCCSKFFTKVWMQDGGVDTTWQQAVCTMKPFIETQQKELCNLPAYDDTTIELPTSTPIWASNLLRWAGMKLVTHLPCSFTCKESKRIALENLGLATKHGFGNEYNKLCKMLDWDTTWTAHMGIATIETPVFIINTVTDITTEKYIVHKNGHNNCIL